MMEPASIAVDLTPVLPGGENGGAKVFVLELLRRLSARHREAHFLLLTHGASHEELAALDAPNVERLLVLGGKPAVRRLHGGMKGVARRVAAALPRRVSIPIALAASRMIKRRPGGPSLRERGVGLLFCPFTAPTYREAGLPLVSTIYDLQFRAYPQFFRPEDAGHREQVFLSACRHATALVAISDHTRDSAIENGAVEAPRIRTVYLRMAQRMRHDTGPDAGVLLSSLGLSAQNYLIYPANFWKHKNHEMLLTAFGMAVRAGLSPELKLVCTGSALERSEWLRRAAAMLGIGERVVFPGYVTDEALAILLGASRGLVFPSLHEGFGLPVIEAMAAGIPVACSDSTSLPEVASGAALLFDPRVPSDISRALMDLSSDPATRARLIDAGRRRASEFADATRMADDYWEVFRFALASGGERGAGPVPVPGPTLDSSRG
jgi:glycosyltransferase involved in cell wall biosynthesis